MTNVTAMPMPKAVSVFFDTPRKGQQPMNLFITKLLTCLLYTSFYKLCRDCDYIKVDRIAKNMRFFEDTEAGKLEITINLSKPEKDPRDIAAQRIAKQTGYPKCCLLYTSRCV